MKITNRQQASVYVNDKTMDVRSFDVNDCHVIASSVRGTPYWHMHIDGETRLNLDREGVKEFMMQSLGVTLELE